MANNNSIQILRALPTCSIEQVRLLDGQPFYHKGNKQLYVGDQHLETYKNQVEDTAGNIAQELENTEIIKSVGAANIRPGTSQDSIVQVVDAYKDDPNTISEATYGTWQNQAVGFQAIALGVGSKAANKRSVAIGNQCGSFGNTSFVIGQKNEAKGSAVFMGGHRCTSDENCDYSMIYGVETHAKNQSTKDIILGNANNIDHLKLGAIIGARNTISATTVVENDFIFGDGNEITNTNIGTIIGKNNSIENAHTSTLIGKGNKLKNSSNSTFVGYENLQTNDVQSNSNFLFGYSNIITGVNDNKYGIGFRNTISNNPGLALGFRNTVDTGIAIGRSNTTHPTNDCHNTLLLGNNNEGYGFTLGSKNKVSGEYSFAIGYGNQSGYDIKIGQNNDDTDRIVSVVIGKNNACNANCSTIIGGYSNELTADYSGMIGIGLKNSKSDYTLTIGSYNNDVEGARFIVGAGDDDNSRKNIIEAYKTKININGNVDITGGSLSVDSIIGGVNSQALDITCQTSFRDNVDILASKQLTCGPIYAYEQIISEKDITSYNNISVGNAFIGKSANLKGGQLWVADESGKNTYFGVKLNGDKEAVFKNISVLIEDTSDDAPWPYPFNYSYVNHTLHLNGKTDIQYLYIGGSKVTFYT